MNLQQEPYLLDNMNKKNDLDSFQISQDSLISKLETLYKSSQEEYLSSSKTIDFHISSSIPFSSNKEEPNFQLSSSKNDTLSQNQLMRSALLKSFNTQKTTIILQKIILEASKEEIENIVNELFGKYRQVIKDKNGNYFCSDLFKVCDQKQRIKILKELTNTICDDCVDKFGTHPIQTLIEFSSSEEEYKLLLNSFNDYNKLLFASIDPYGSYVITKIIEHIPEKFRIEFNKIFIQIICFICTKKFGVCNAKKFFSCVRNEEIIRKAFDLIKENFINIASNDYGNYLIQYLLEKWWNTNLGEEIKELIRINVKILATNKYSSFIVDLYLKLSSNEEKIQLLKFLNRDINNNNNNPNNYDNYIITKIFKSLEQSNIADNINNNFNCFNNNNKNILPLSLNNNFTYNNLDNNKLPLSLNNMNKNNQNIINNNKNKFYKNNNNVC